MPPPMPMRAATRMSSTPILPAAGSTETPRTVGLDDGLTLGLGDTEGEGVLVTESSNTTGCELGEGVALGEGEVVGSGVAEGLGLADGDGFGLGDASTAVSRTSIMPLRFWSHSD